MSGLNQQTLRNFFYSSRCPGTVALIAIYVVTFFMLAGLSIPGFVENVAFVGALPEKFWTLITWPLLGADRPLNVLFACLWAFWVCGSLERSWGTRTFLIFFFAAAALTALTFWMGELLLFHSAVMPVTGLWIALGAPTIAWCVLNQRESIYVWGILKIPAPLMGLLTLVLVWYDLGAHVVGLFGLSGCAAGYWYAQNGHTLQRAFSPARFGGRKGKSPDLRLKNFDRESAPGFSPMRWFKARQEQRKLEQLWKRSFDDDKK